MKILALFCVCSFVSSNAVPIFEPKPRIRLVSPDQKRVAYTVRRTKRDRLGESKWMRLYISSTNDKPGKPLIKDEFFGYDFGTGIRQFDWSDDSKLIVFDFILNQPARVPIDGFSFVGVADVTTGRGWILPDRGCHPQFVGKRTIEFLSFHEKLSNGSVGKLTYRIESSALYKHRLVLEQPTDERLIFNSTKIVNFDWLDNEFLSSR